MILPHQYLIGGVALTIGCLSLVASLANHEGFFQLAKMRLLENLMGRRGARLACGAVGCGLIVLGVLIVAGKLPRKASTDESLLPAIPQTTLASAFTLQSS